MDSIRNEERPRILADENFNRRITIGLLLHYPAIDLLTVQEAQIRGLKDPELLRFAMQVDRILLTHDDNTIPNYFWELLAQLSPGEVSPGVWLVDNDMAIGLAIQTIAEYWGGSRHEEWQNRVTQVR